MVKKGQTHYILKGTENGTPPVFGGVHVAHLFSFLCCVLLCLSLYCVSCAQCCQCLLIVHSWLPLRNYEVIYVIKTVMKYHLKKIDTSFHQPLPNMVQRLFSWRHKWRDLVYEYSWAKSPMISGYDDIWKSNHSFDHINNFIIICDRIKINCHHMFIRNPMMCVKDRKYI
jgi:hypothetical protein